MADKVDLNDILRDGGPDAVRDYIDSHGETYEPKPQVHANPPPQAEDEDDVPFVAADKLLERKMQPRRFLVEDHIPLAQVTELRGDGKTGKSTLGLQLAVCAVTGLNWLGMHVTQGPAIVLASEDDLDELHRRLDAICVHYGIPNDDPRLAALWVWPLASEDPALVVPDARGQLEATPRFEQLLRKIEAIDPVVVILDSRADVFGGDEIRRLHVRTFIGLLRKTAVRTVREAKPGTAIVILAHPSRAGLADETKNSGSTHWTNAVRAVLVLERPDVDAEDQVLVGEETRILHFGPANYSAPTGKTLKLRWSAGAFVIEEDNPPEPPRPFASRAEREAEIDQLFLQLVDRSEAAGQRLSDAPTSGKYAPRLFAKDPLAKGVSERALALAMARLFAVGVIHMVTVGAPSRGTQKIERRPPSGPAASPTGSHL